MSSVIPGDRDLHYSDNSHRWIAPPTVHQRECQRRLAEAAAMEKARENNDTSTIMDIELRRMLEGR